MNFSAKYACLAAVILLSAVVAMAQEKFSRAFVAVEAPNGVALGWRYLLSDGENSYSVLYRNGEQLARVSNSTFYLDTLPQPADYTLKTYKADGELLDEAKLSSAQIMPAKGLRIPLEIPTPLTPRNDSEYAYRPNDASVGDVDNDGDFELILKWSPTNEHDNSHRGITGSVLFACYEFDGTRRWLIDLGQNIRAGAHYTQFLVYDFDGDGHAEFACKTAPGSKDANGNFVSEAATDAAIKSTDNERSYVNVSGHILEGPEYLTVFSGQTGEALHTVNYDPPRDVISWEKWGDGYGNRHERYLACVAFLPNDNNVPTPSLVMCRGYYTYAFLAAYQFRNGRLEKRWLYETPEPDPTTTLYHAGAHSISVADVDGDGFDEITYGAAALDHDGSFLYNTGWGHGDALHVSDLVPSRPGLEVFMPHEAFRHAGIPNSDTEYNYGLELRDARTGEILWAKSSDEDNGRGLAADIDSTYEGFEFWSLESSFVYDVDGNPINESVAKRPPVNFRIYWDGDLQDELLDGGVGRRRDPNTAAAGVYKWDSQSKSTYLLAALPGLTCNGTKNTPCFMADIWGDWREEVILYSAIPLDSTQHQPDGSMVPPPFDRTMRMPGDSITPPPPGRRMPPQFDPKMPVRIELIIHTSPMPTQYKVPALPQDHVYRMGMIWQNCAYNQPPHLGYYLPSLFKKSM